MCVLVDVARDGWGERVGWVCELVLIDISVNVCGVYILVYACVCVYWCVGWYMCVAEGRCVSGYVYVSVGELVRR